MDTNRRQKNQNNVRACEERRLRSKTCNLPSCLEEAWDHGNLQVYQHFYFFNCLRMHLCKCDVEITLKTRTCKNPHSFEMWLNWIVPGPGTRTLFLTNREPPKGCWKAPLHEIVLYFGGATLCEPGPGCRYSAFDFFVTSDFAAKAAPPMPSLRWLTLFSFCKNNLRKNQTWLKFDFKTNVGTSNSKRVENSWWVQK